jgi:hypothetical protein
MHGVTTALVGFLFVCVVFPQLIRNRPQYYAAFGLVCVIILLDALGFMVGAAAFRVFVYFAIAVLQVGAICLFFLAAGGITWRDLGGEFSNAFEVIRRGGEEKEIIVPLRGEVPRKPPGGIDDDDDDAPPPRINIDDPSGSGPAPPPPRQDSDRNRPNSSIPLE